MPKVCHELTIVGVCLMGWLALGGCRSRSSAVGARYAPEASPLRLAEPYQLNVEPAAAGLNSICASDPERCPDVDLVAAQGLGLGGSAGPQVLLTGPLRGAQGIAGKDELMSARGTRQMSKAESKVIGGQHRRTAPTPERPPRAEHATRQREMEAHLTLDVDELPTAVVSIRELIEQFSGELVSEVYQDSPSQYGAALSIRVPVAKTSEFLARTSALGRVQSRRVESKDISRKLLDADLLLRNLRQALKRYEELLARAENVADMAGVEASLARLRTQIERVEGDLRWLSDLGARSSIYLKLTNNERQQYQQAPAAKLWPSARLVSLFDLGEGAGAQAFGGGGFSYLFSRRLGFDAAVLRSLEEPSQTVFSTSFGGDVYSDFLGAGQRRALNPFLGFRAAYIHALGTHQAALGATLGLELFRTEHLLIDVQARGYAAFGSRAGLHPLLEPSVGVGAAF